MKKLSQINRIYASILGIGCSLSAIAHLSIPDWVAAETEGEQCEIPSTRHAAQPLPPIVNHLMEVARWSSDPGVTLNQVVGYLGPQIETLWTSQSWPNIAEQARQAKVPVMMYHDILAEKEVFFDVTPEEFEDHLKLIQAEGLTPISLEHLVNHLQTGVPLPAKPILLTFDDGYKGHFQYVYPLLKKYNYPGVFSIYTNKIGQTAGRPGVSWSDLKQMAADPLVTIAAHSISHPDDLRLLSDGQLRQEIFESRQILEQQLGIAIEYFTYPAGNYDERVSQFVAAAGFKAAMTMDQTELNEKFANESETLLTLERFGQSNLPFIVHDAFGGAPLARWSSGFNFHTPITLDRPTIDDVDLILISGGKPITIHADRRGQVQEILADSPAIAGVDGGFFSLDALNSNVMIGPVLSQTTQKFIPGNASENPRLNGRPLVLMSETYVKFVPFDAQKHNTLAGVQAELPDVQDTFVGAAFLVRNGQAQPYESFGNLFDFDAARHRAFWGINQAGVPVVGVTDEPVGSVYLGELLVEAGFRDAVMLDSGASTSLAYNGDSLVGYIPRPVPHVVGLVPPAGMEPPQSDCKPGSDAV